MPINRECFIKSVKSDASLTGIVILAIIGIIAALIVVYLVCVEATPVAIDLIKFCFTLMGKPFETAYGSYILFCLATVVIHLLCLVGLEKTDIYKSTSVIISTLFTFALVMVYGLYYNLSAIPACAEGVYVMCRITAESPYPSVLLETGLVIVWLWVSTPLIIAYKRCKV